MVPLSGSIAYHNDLKESITFARHHLLSAIIHIVSISSNCLPPLIVYHPPLSVIPIVDSPLSVIVCNFPMSVILHCLLFPLYFIYHCLSFTLSQPLYIVHPLFVIPIVISHCLSSTIVCHLPLSVFHIIPTIVYCSPIVCNTHCHFPLFIIHHCLSFTIVCHSHCPNHYILFTRCL